MPWKDVGGTLSCTGPLAEWLEDFSIWSKQDGGGSLDSPQFMLYAARMTTAIADRAKNKWSHEIMGKGKVKQLDTLLSGKGLGWNGIFHACDYLSEHLSLNEMRIWASEYLSSPDKHHAHGLKEYVEVIVLFVRIDTISQYVPTGITMSGTAISIDAKAIIQSLFGYPAPAKLEQWIASGKLSMAVTTAGQSPPSSPAEAAGSVARTFGSKFTMEQLKELGFYVFSSKGTPQAMTTYLVILGSLPDAPSEAYVG